MGISIFVPGVNWSDRNLGRVTPSGDVPIESITILGPNSITAPTTFYAELHPTFTTERGVSWSVTSGGTYATIDQNGVLTPGTGALYNSVTIRATSTVNASVYAEKEVTVSDVAVIIGTTVTFDGHCAIDTGINASMPTEIQVTLASVNPSQWGILNGNTPTSVIIGGRVSSSVDRRDIQLQTTTGQTNIIKQIIFGVGTTSKVFSSLSLSKDSELYLGQGPTYYRYNSSTTARTNPGTFDSTVHYVIGAQNDNGTLSYTYASHDVYKRVKIYSTEGGTLVGDFVPAILSGEHGMWNNVNNTFYHNIGTGTLIVQ